MGYPTKTTGIEEATETTTRMPNMRDRTPIMSLVSLSETHHEIGLSKLRQLLDDEEKAFGSDDYRDNIADHLTKQIDILNDIALHFDTARTTILLQTITNCPNCGFDLRTRRR